MARRSEHSQIEIKQMVLQAAEDIVQQQGYSALKVRKIAADIGYTVGSIYMVFSNMNDLNMHIKAHTWQQLLLHLEQNINLQKKVSLASINQFATEYLEFAVLNAGLWRMLFEHQLPTGEKVPDWYIQESLKIQVFAYQILKQLNSTFSDMQLKRAARTLIKSIQGVCMQLIIQQQSEANINEAKADIEFLVDCFMSGWLEKAE